MPPIYRPGQCIDHYEIIRLLGQGGASHVYLARDQQAQQEVVLKFPLDDIIGGRAIFERYQREKEVGGRLTHPGLQHHLNQDETRSTDYLVLEYVSGQTLRTVMQKMAPELLSEEEVRGIMLQVCEALAYVHAQGVIHRDIKPENILLREAGGVALLDFGLAEHVGERSGPWRTFSSPVGTPDYMAPELWRGKRGSVQADIYAVGVMLYELLCGRTPFEEQDGFSLTSRNLSHDPPDILAFQPALSPALATVVMRAIRRDPAKRYASMQELVRDLACPEEVTPVAYVPDPPLVGGRYRQVMGIVLIVLVIFLLILAFGVFAQAMHAHVR